MNSLSSWVVDYRTAMKSGRWLPYCYVERLVRAATRKGGPLEPSKQQIKQIVKHSFDKKSRWVIFKVLEVRLARPCNIYKALVALEALLLRGTERTKEFVDEHYQGIEFLSKSIGYVDNLTGIEYGNMICARARAALKLTYNPEAYAIRRSQAKIEDWLLEACEGNNAYINMDIGSTKQNDIKLITQELDIGCSVSEQGHNSECNNDTQLNAANMGARKLQDTRQLHTINTVQALTVVYVWATFVVNQRGEILQKEIQYTTQSLIDKKSKLKVWCCGRRYFSAVIKFGQEFTYRMCKILFKMYWGSTIQQNQTKVLSCPLQQCVDCGLRNIDVVSCRGRSRPKKQ